VGEFQAVFREFGHVWCEYFSGAVCLRVELAMIIGDEDDDVGLFSSAQES